MDKITFRTLSGVDLSVLHAIWLRAFSDYVVSMQCSEEQFRNRLVREGCDYNASVGIFAGGEIVGFTFNSIGVWDGVPTAYDAGTAIAPEFRGRHLGEELFQFMFPLLKERGAEQYLLEVITTNTPAVNLYRKLGFRTTRELGSPVLAGDVTTLSNRNNSSVSIREISLPDREIAEGFWDWRPSWENSSDSLQRSKGNCVSLGAFDKDQLIGYGVIFPNSGNISQLAVAKSYRRKGVGSLILKHLRSAIDSNKPLKMSNIDLSSPDTAAFCAAHQFSPLIDQFEMIKVL